MGPEVIAMAELIPLLEDMLDNVINAIPSIIAAIIVLALGILVGILIGDFVNLIVKRTGFERAIDQTNVGRSMRATGADPSKTIGTVVKAIIIVLAVIFAVQILDFGGVFGDYLNDIATYLPLLLAGVLILVFGAILADFLASFVGRIIKPMFSAEKGGIAEALRNMLFIGLLAFVLLLALDVIRLPGDLVYPLILAFVIIGVGISLTDALIRSIIVDHAEFAEVAGFAKFILYAIFLIIGAGALFALFPGVTNIVANISWAFAIAFAIMLIPIVYALAQKMVKQLK